MLPPLHPPLSAVVVLPTTTKQSFQGIMLCNIQHDGARKVADLEGQVNELTRAVRHQAEVIEALQSQIRGMDFSGVRSSVSTIGGAGSTYDVYGGGPRPGDESRNISAADVRNLHPNLRESAQSFASRNGIRDGGSFAASDGVRVSGASARDARRLLSVDM